MVEQLITVPARNANERMADFIADVRYNCAAFGTDLEWERPDWNVTKHCPKPAGKAAKTSILYFTTHKNGSAKSAAGRVPMQEPFASFVKAVVRRKQDDRPQTDGPLNRVINAARDLYDLLEHRGYDPVRLTSADFDQAAILGQKRASAATAYRLGCALQEIAETIDHKSLTIARINWKNPLKRQTNALSRISPYAEQARAEKLPAPETLDEIARISHLVSEPDDVVLMAAIKLCHCAPWRIGEVLTLPENCEVEEEKVGPSGIVQDENGEPVRRYGVRYWKEKSKDPDIKWIPTVMVDTAKKAIADIRRHTEGARQLARWLEEHPRRAWLPGPDLGPDQTYSKAEVAELFGMGRDHKAGRQWLANRGLLPSGERKPRIRRADLEEALLKEMVEAPDDRRNMKLSEHLFLVHRHFYHDNKATNPCLLALTTDQNVSDFLSGRTSDRGSALSVFERFGSPPLPDGSPMGMNSHQFRHWLNTLAQEGSLDQALIARWSGRDDINQNSEYDHVSGIQLAGKFRSMMERGEIKGALAEAHERKDPVDRAAFREAVFATAHVTDIGLCDLDWVSSTCPEFSACENCEFCLVEKGSAGSKERTEQRLADNLWLLTNVEAEAADGTYGASNHLVALQQSIAGCERILAVHSDPSIPDGTLVQPTAASPQHFAGPGLEDAA